MLRNVACSEEEEEEKTRTKAKKVIENVCDSMKKNGDIGDPEAAEEQANEGDCALVLG